jgi:Domain of unknown function DUF29
MNRSAVYEDDILEWSEQQAAALRHLARTRPDMSNEIDWENVAEEIECVGRSEFAAVLSYIRQILTHLIKAVSVSEGGPLLHWRSEVVAFHRDLLDRISPLMHPRIDMSRLWRQALRQAEADLAVHGQTVAALPKDCPLQLVEIADPQFDFIAAVDRLRRRLDNERPSR